MKKEGRRGYANSCNKNERCPGGDWIMESDEIVDQRSNLKCKK